MVNASVTRDENGRKTSQSFSIFTFEYENESESGKAGHETNTNLWNNQEFQKRTNSSGIMSNTVDIRKINMEY
jgi:hypothetical protein